MTLSDSDDVQTISSGSDDNKEREKKTQGKMEERGNCLFSCVTSLDFLLSK